MDFLASLYLAQCLRCSQYVALCLRIRVRTSHCDCRSCYLAAQPSLSSHYASARTPLSPCASRHGLQLHCCTALALQPPCKRRLLPCPAHTLQPQLYHPYLALRPLQPVLACPMLCNPLAAANALHRTSMHGSEASRAAPQQLRRAAPWSMHARPPGRRRNNRVVPHLRACMHGLPVGTHPTLELRRPYVRAIASADRAAAARLSHLSRCSPAPSLRRGPDQRRRKNSAAHVGFEPASSGSGGAPHRSAKALRHSRDVAAGLRFVMPPFFSPHLPRRCFSETRPFSRSPRARCACALCHGARLFPLRARAASRRRAPSSRPAPAVLFRS